MPRQSKKREQNLSHGKKTIQPSNNLSEIIVVASGILLLFAFLYTTDYIFSPFLLFSSIIFLLYPLRTIAIVKNIIILTIALFLFWIFDSIDVIVVPFVISLLLAYILHPFVTKCEQWRIPRWASSLIIVLCSVGSVIVIAILLLPQILIQFESILQTVNSFSIQFAQWVLDGSFVQTLNKFGISTEHLKTLLSDSFVPKLENIMKGLFEGIFGIVNKISVLITGIVNIIIIPFLTFYVLKDFPLIKYRVKMLIPKVRRERSVVYYNYIDGVLGRYIRGTAIIAVIDAITVTIVFWLIGIQYPLVLGIVSGILFFIPYFGFITILLISTIVAPFSGEPVIVHLILAWVSLVSLHIVENFILSPRIIGTKIGLHPVLLIFSIFVFSHFLGFIGLLIAIPAAGSIIVITKEWEINRKKNITTRDR